MATFHLNPDEEAGAGGVLPISHAKLDQLNENAQEKRKSTAQDEEVVSARKEKSVLQTKLTKLAIQIGYGGWCPTSRCSNWFKLFN